MAFIELTIDEPKKDAVFVCPRQGDMLVKFLGIANRPRTLAGVPLFYRWYSSLSKLAKDPNDPGGGVSRFSLNEVALTDPEREFEATLPIGSHAIVFAASDRSAEADIVNSQHGGVIGGVTKQGAGHVIHILKANILWPADTQNVVDVSPGAEFKAEAPWAWDDQEGYDKYNKLGYRWLFEPVPPLHNRPVLDFNLPSMDFHKATSSTPNTLAFRPQLPANATGPYTLTLQVRCLDAPQTAPTATDRRNLNLI